MDLTITNYSGQPLIVLTSDQLYDKTFITTNLPNISSLLGTINDQSWLSSLEGRIYADKIDELVSKTRQALDPQIKYQDFILAGDTAFMRNIIVAPKYIYCIGISSKNQKLVLTFNTFNTEASISKYTQAEDLLTAVRIYLGSIHHNSTMFYCDNVTPDGEPVCNKPLPASARFINGAYNQRHNPQLAVVTQDKPTDGYFETTMIDKITGYTHLIMENMPVAGNIPPVGVDGQTLTAYMFLGNTEDTTFAMSADNRSTFTIANPPNTWASIAVLLFVLLLIAILVGIGFYLLKKGGVINVYGSNESSKPESIII